MLKFFRHHFTLLISTYIVLRAASFALQGYAWAEETIAALIIGVFIYVCLKNISLAWKLLVLELLIDGAGHFFELRSLLLRTWFLGIFALVWVWHKVRTRSPIILPAKNILIALGVFGVFLTWSMVNGFMRGNAPMFIVQDAILYLFILLLFPALEFENKFQPIYTAAIKVFIFGSTFFSLLTLALYSSGVFVLTDSYYHWFRNVASGKITDLGFNFFRIVLPEQILFVPIILILFSLLIKKVSDKKLWVLMACSLIVLTLNFTRIYILALAVGALILLYRVPLKQWFKTAGITLTVSLLIFFSIHFVSSRGESTGLDLIGVRISGIRAPQSDVSGAIRMAMLPDILKTIAARPLQGSGLGTTVTYIDPVTKSTETRTQFDWGYLEMIAELGIVGATAYIILLMTIIYNFARSHKDSNFGHGLIAGAIALFIVNITTPALFQGFGVLYFVFLASQNTRFASVHTTK